MALSDNECSIDTFTPGVLSVNEALRIMLKQLRLSGLLESQETVGQSVTFTAEITGPSGTPIGTVTFYVNGSQIDQPQTLASGHASVTTSALSQGTHSITVLYSGDGIYRASTGSLTGGQVVNAATDLALYTGSANQTALSAQPDFAPDSSSHSSKTDTWVIALALSEGQEPGPFATLSASDLSVQRSGRIRHKRPCVAIPDAQPFFFRRSKSALVTSTNAHRLRPEEAS
jgi:hypothetical protein